MAFEGIILIDDPLKVRRPKDHGGSESVEPSTQYSCSRRCQHRCPWFARSTSTFPDKVEGFKLSETLQKFDHLLLIRVRRQRSNEKISDQSRGSLVKPSSHSTDQVTRSVEIRFPQIRRPRCHRCRDSGCWSSARNNDTPQILLLWESIEMTIL